MSGRYWAEREAAKRAALKMAAKLSAREKGTVVLGVNRGMCDEARHDQTQQRSFERTFLSLDCPDDDGNLYDYGDCGREMRRTLRSLDAPFRERIRDLRFAAALERVPEAWHPLLGMIRDRIPRAEIMRQCCISRATYFRRIEAMRQMVKA